MRVVDSSATAAVVSSIAGCAQPRRSVAVAEFQASAVALARHAAVPTPIPLAAPLVTAAAASRNAGPAYPVKPAAAAGYRINAAPELAYHNPATRQARNVVQSVMAVVAFSIVVAARPRKPAAAPGSPIIAVLAVAFRLTARRKTPTAAAAGSQANTGT